MIKYFPETNELYLFEELASCCYYVLRNKKEKTFDVMFKLIGRKIPSMIVKSFCDEESANLYVKEKEKTILNEYKESCNPTLNYSNSTN